MYPFRASTTSLSRQNPTTTTVNESSTHFPSVLALRIVYIYVYIHLCEVLSKETEKRSQINTCGRNLLMLFSHARQHHMCARVSARIRVKRGRGTVLISRNGGRTHRASSLSLFFCGGFFPVGDFRDNRGERFFLVFFFRIFSLRRDGDCACV